MLFGSSEVPQKIEFISYSPEYREQTLDVIKNSFFKFETVSVASEINTNPAGQDDLIKLCEDALQRSNVSIIARDVEKNLIIGAALNVIQVKEPGNDGPSYFEHFRDNVCKTENAKSLMNYMIVADSKVDLFEKFDITALFEIMFLAVLPEYGRKDIGLNLVKYSVQLAKDLKAGKNVKTFLANNEPLPKIVSALWTGRNSQKIGRKLGFEVIFAESFKEFTFCGRNFADRVDDPEIEYHLAALEI